MLGIAALAFIFAYGRVAKSFGLRALAILAVLALAITYLSAMMLHAPFDSTLLLPAAIQFALQTALFGLGCLLGRWLDRDKYSD